MLLVKDLGHWVAVIGCIEDEDDENSSLLILMTANVYSVAGMRLPC